MSLNFSKADFDPLSNPAPIEPIQHVDVDEGWDSPRSNEKQPAQQQQASSNVDVSSQNENQQSNKFTEQDVDLDVDMFGNQNNSNNNNDSQLDKVHQIIKKEKPNFRKDVTEDSTDIDDLLIFAEHHQQRKGNEKERIEQVDNTLLKDIENDNDLDILLQDENEKT